MNLWNVKKAAEYLNRSEGAIRNLVLRRSIPFRKVGGRLMFIETEIKTWVGDSPGLTLEDLMRGEN